MTSLPLPKNRRPSGFSLVEVALAAGIMAIAIPAILGMFAIFSKEADSIMEDGDTALALNAFQMFLDGKAADPITNQPVTFTDIYGWVEQHSTDVTLIYAYKIDENLSDYIVSETAPPATSDGKILAAEILPPEITVPPAAAIVPDADDYKKSYLPIKLSVHALSAATQDRTSATLVDTYPLVISR